MILGAKNTTAPFSTKKTAMLSKSESPSARLTTTLRETLVDDRKEIQSEGKR